MGGATKHWNNSATGPSHVFMRVRVCVCVCKLCKAILKYPCVNNLLISKNMKPSFIKPTYSGSLKEKVKLLQWKKVFLRHFNAPFSDKFLTSIGEPLYWTRYFYVEYSPSSSVTRTAEVFAKSIPIHHSGIDLMIFTTFVIGILPFNKLVD